MTNTIKYDTRKWRDLGVGDKIKLSIAAGLVLSSVVLGFISFIILLEIPTSAIALDGLWLSTALAILGISAHFNNEMTKFQAKVSDRLDRIDHDRQYHYEEDEEQPTNTDNTTQ